MDDEKKDPKTPNQPPVDENIFKNLPPLERMDHTMVGKRQRGTEDNRPTGRIPSGGQFATGRIPTGRIPTGLDGSPTGRIPTGLDGSPTGRIQLDSTGRFQGTGRFRRSPSKKPTDGEDLSEPTQKIILFPTEESQKLPNATHLSPQKPPIVFTAPLPKVQDLPSDFFEEDELDELYDPSNQKEDSLHVFSGEEDEFPEFQEEESKLASLMRELERKADRYADNMFLESETEDVEAIQRLERLIPGTDQEDGRRVRRPPSREKIKLPRTRPLPPDCPPKELGKQLHKGFRFRRFRRKSLFVASGLASLISFFPMEFTGDFLWMAKYENQVLTLSFLLFFGMILTMDLLWKGLLRCFTLRVGMDSIGLFSGIFCGLDCFLQSTGAEHRGQYPYVALILLQYAFLLYGDEEKRKANMCGCQVAGIAEMPYLITLEPRKWNGKATYTKSSAPPHDFTSQLQQDDGVQNVFAWFSPLFLVGSFLVALNLTRTTSDFVWAFSALLVVAAPFGGGFLYGRAAHKVADRLKELYTALAGWPGVAGKGTQCVVGDEDLFPVGDVRITGRQEYHGFSEKKVLAYTSALLKEGNVGCSKLFLDMMAYRGQKCPSCKKVAFHDGGGISANIGIDQVLVGGAAFTELMNVAIPEGLFVNHAVFCSINGKLAGFYSLEYSLNNIVNHSLDNLLYEQIRPVLATRDFALTPEILKKRFHLNTMKMDFPSVMRRYDLSSTERPKKGTLTAIITREGIASVADCVIGARRLRATVLQGIAICLASSFLGLCLIAYLVASQAYLSLSADNLMIFMLLWTAPIWVLTDLPQRF